MRTPFQGVTNIVRFNWHFYALAALPIIIGLIVAPLPLTSTQLRPLLYLGIILTAATTIISLLASHIIYDRSPLYALNWLDELPLPEKPTVININAGFDETSVTIESKRPDAQLQIYDFYDEKKHTEISIKRARTVYPPHPNHHHRLPATNDRQR